MAIVFILDQINTPKISGRTLNFLTFSENKRHFGKYEFCSSRGFRVLHIVAGAWDEDTEKNFQLR